MRILTINKGEIPEASALGLEFAELLLKADRLGLDIEIKTCSMKPLAMGNTRKVTTISPNRLTLKVAEDAAEADRASRHAAAQPWLD